MSINFNTLNMNFSRTKYSIFSLFLLLVITFSCKIDNDDIDLGNTTNESFAARTAMAELKSQFSNEGLLLEERTPTGNIIFDFCFDFVYPITLSYNTGVAFDVENFDQLVTVLVNSNDNMYVNGISFPFQVERYHNGAIEIQTINNEEEFLELIESCGIGDNTIDDCICTEEYNPVCVEIQEPNGGSFMMEFPNICYAMCEGFSQNDIVQCDHSNPANGFFDDCFSFEYPFSVVDNNGNTITINDENELNNVLYSHYVFDFVYPFNITMTSNNQTTTINNADEFITVLIGCASNNGVCTCPGYYDPVCIELNGTTINYQNDCFAQCDGFTPNDFVDCNPVDCATNCPPNYYYPVCVEDNNGNIITYNNDCLAACDGYTQNDFVNCNSSDCVINNLNITVGNCITDSVYEIELNFNTTYNGPFTLYDENINIIGHFDTSNLPILFNDIQINGSGSNSVKVWLDNTTSTCYEWVYWDEPNCNTNNCWEFVYPIICTDNNYTYTLNSDAEFDNIYNHDTSYLHYPFQVTFNNNVVNIDTPNDFYNIGEFSTRCN